MTFFLWLFLHIASASTVPASEAVSVLNQSVQLYHVGSRAEAMQGFLTIGYDKGYPISVRHEALMYIAEILYIEGNVDDARTYMLEVLQENPEYRIDAFRHPPEICLEFDAVKRKFVPLNTMVSPSRQYFPKIGYSPFGVYQFRYDASWKAITYSGAQVLLGIASISLYNYLLQNPSYNGYDAVDQKRLESVLLAQRGTTMLFYAVWSISILDARKDWRFDHNPTQE